MEFWGNFNREVALAVLGIHLMMMMEQGESSFEYQLFCHDLCNRICVEYSGSNCVKLDQIGSSLIV